MSRSKEYKPVNNDDAIESNPKNITSVNFYPAIAFVGFCLSVFVTTLLLLLNYFGAIDLSGFTSQNSSNKNSVQLLITLQTPYELRLPQCGFRFSFDSVLDPINVVEHHSSSSSSSTGIGFASSSTRSSSSSSFVISSSQYSSSVRSSSSSPFSSSSQYVVNTASDVVQNDNSASLRSIEIPHIGSVYSSSNYYTFTHIKSANYPFTGFSLPNTTLTEFVWTTDSNTILQPSAPMYEVYDVTNQCTTSNLTQGSQTYDISGTAISLGPTDTAQQCLSMCCRMNGCNGWVWVNWMPSSPYGCYGRACCYLRGSATVGNLISRSDVYSSQSGILTNPAPLFGYETTPPSIGMRSAVPLGGLATGSFELRADGTAQLSTLFNQDLAGESWQGTVRDFLIAVNINGTTNVMRLKPIDGVPGVPNITYQGSFPMSKHRFLNLTLYSYSTIVPGDLTTSLTPAIVFSLRINNQPKDLDVSFMVLVPMGIRNDWKSTSNPIVTTNSNSISDCVSMCGSNCFGWNYDKSARTCYIETSGDYSFTYDAGSLGECSAACGIDCRFASFNNGKCTRGKNGYFQGSYLNGIDGGNPGTFSSPAPLGSTIAFTHQQITNKKYNALGQQALYSSGNNQSTISSCWSVSDCLTQFQLNGRLNNNLGGKLYGALQVNGIIPAGTSRSLDIVYGWYYPTHHWRRDSTNGLDHGNYYTNLWSDAVQVVKSVNSSYVTNKQMGWKKVFQSLPPTMYDMAINLFSHCRNAMYFQNGDWRQWEANMFPDVDSVHNDDERHLPYFWYFPQTERLKIILWKRSQGQVGTQWGDGHITENYVHFYGYQGYDVSSSDRLMSDVTSKWILLIYEHWKINNDRDLMVLLYPNIVRAYTWMTNQAQASVCNLPYALVETYDGTEEGSRGCSLYAASLYLTALSAFVRMSANMSDTTNSNNAQSILTGAKQSVQTLLWTGSYYATDTRGTTKFNGVGSIPAVSADGLHGQVIAYYLGLGDMLPRNQMIQHQQYIVTQLNNTWGMRVDQYKAYTPDSMSSQNWLMGDATYSTLQLYWKLPNAWSQVLLMLDIFRTNKANLWDIPAFFDTSLGQPSFVDHYGFVMWAYHAIPAYSGLDVDFIYSTLTIKPYDKYGTFPVLWGGHGGTITIDTTTATITMAWGNDTFFNSLIVHDQVLSAGPYRLSVGLSLVLTSVNGWFAISSSSSSGVASSSSTFSSSADVTSSSMFSSSSSSSFLQTNNMLNFVNNPTLDNFMYVMQSDYSFNNV